MTATAYTAAPAQEAAAQAAQQRAENNMHLTPGQYKGLALVCVLLGVWASWITWRFFVHGSQAMEADPSVLEISIAAATMFIVCEMGAFALAKMLPAERLYALRCKPPHALLATHNPANRVHGLLNPAHCRLFANKLRVQAGELALLAANSPANYACA